MRIHTVDGQDYRLPNVLSEFQLGMYVHLINWKWQHITKGTGYYRHKGKQIPYDAILPQKYMLQGTMPHLHNSILGHLAAHCRRNPFRIHPHFYHMASSQAANINLFIPILHHSAANAILGTVKKDLKSLATDQLDHGYCLECWGENFGSPPSGKGLLGDKTARTGTDSDIAIAYRNHEDELCLWLIEHKLVEPEFTTCGGYKSKGRTDKVRHDCTHSFSEIIADKNTCYYHDRCRYHYWTITEANLAFFPNHNRGPCPFRGGMNQLWRNQLLGLAIEKDGGQPFKHVYFSVVHHPDNKALDCSLVEYRKLINDNAKFSTLTSADVMEAATRHASSGLGNWIAWYKDLYRV